MAREFGSKIYTCFHHERVNAAYPGIEDMLVVDRIKHPDSFTRMPLEVMKRMTERNDIDADFLVYSGNFPIYRIRKDPSPYLYVCYTPERGFFDLREQTMERVHEWGFPRGAIARYLFNRRRKEDLSFFSERVNPKQVVTNSRLVMDRYEKAYGKRPRKVVGAPIETEKYRWKEPEDFFFTAGGLRWNKRVDWQIEAVSRTGHRLKIAGDGPARKELEELARKKGADVEFLGMLDDKELVDHYSRCKAFIFTAKDEDFGLVPLEAMASGKPVIAVREGGPLEYLNDGNSILFDDIEGLERALLKHTDQDYLGMKDRCRRDAMRFDTPVVAERIMGEIHGVMKDFYQ
ncbi:MAG: glycosyltransferase [Candidatus Thermoplasmatota archaeon]|nr:glycosyltransferase [Candidatus Thermoplasmatota archaeon]